VGNPKKSLGWYPIFSFPIFSFPISSCPGILSQASFPPAPGYRTPLVLTGSFISFHYSENLGEGMDKFDTGMKDLIAQKPEDQKRKIMELRKLCMCPNCPTYTSCARTAEEKLFCSTGGSFKCISEDKGCLCPECPVADAMGLNHTRFCMNGDEFKQRYLHRIRKEYQMTPF
jgi:hypothetical protein